MGNYSISEVAKMKGLSHSALRYYEEIGLLTNVEHEGNKRIYTEEHLRRIDGILCFKRTNLPINKILEFYSYEEHLEQNIEEIIQLVEIHEQSIIQEIETLHHNLEHISDKVMYYKMVKEALEHNLPIPQWDEIFEEGNKGK